VVVGLVDVSAGVRAARAADALSAAASGDVAREATCGEGFSCPTATEPAKLETISTTGSQPPTRRTASEPSRSETSHAVSAVGLAILEIIASSLVKGIMSYGTNLPRESAGCLRFHARSFETFAEPAAQCPWPLPAARPLRDRNRRCGRNSPCAPRLGETRPRGPLSPRPELRRREYCGGFTLRGPEQFGCGRPRLGETRLRGPLSPRADLWRPQRLPE
jgi:hypothetical protein